MIRVITFGCILFGFSCSFSEESPWFECTSRKLGLAVEEPATSPLTPFDVEERRSDVGLIRIRIRAQGVYSLTGLDLRLAGWPVEELRGDRIRMQHRGREVAILTSTNGLLHDSDRIWFYAEGHDGSHSDERVYWAGPGPSTRMAAASPSAGGPLRTTHRAQAVLRRPVILASTFQPAAEFDHWFAGRAGPAADFSATLVLDRPLPDRPASLILRAADAYSRWWQDEATPIQVSVNGRAGGPLEFSGTGLSLSRLDVAASLLRPGANQVVLRASMGQALVRDLTINYERRLASTAAGDLCFATGDQAGRWRSTGFSPGTDWFLDVTDPDRPQVLPVEDDGTLPLAAGRVAYLCSASRVRAAAAEPAGLADDFLADGPADYLIVTDLGRLPNAARLAALREERGLRARVLDLREIFDHFAYGYRSPAAIRRAVAWLHHRQETPPRFVVLVGDGSDDPRGWTGAPAADIVPVVTGPGAFNLAAHDQYYACVQGLDLLPDLALGRIPARTPAQLDAFIDKLAAHESAATDKRAAPAHAMFAADDRDNAGDFRQVCEDLRTAHFAACGSTAYLDDIDLDTARSAVLGTLATGRADWMVYNGHGYSSQWAAGLLDDSDADHLANERTPIVVALACSTGAFQHEGTRSISESLLLQRHGAVAVVAATALTTQFNSTRLADGLLQAARGDRVETLGEAVLAGRRRLHRSVPGSKALLYYQLIGDPALRINPPVEQIRSRLAWRGGKVYLSWNTQPGGTYRVHECGQLGSGAFRPTGKDHLATGDAITIELGSPAHPSCAFRIERLDAPE